MDRRALLKGLLSACAYSSLGASVGLWSQGVFAQKAYSNVTNETPTRFVVGTSLIADILSDLLPEAKILTLSQGSSCPMHGDMKSQDAFAATEADMILIHDFQTKIPAIQGVLTAAAHPGLRLETLQLGGNWMTPLVQKAASQMIAQRLVKAFPAITSMVDANLAQRLTKIDALSLELETELAPMRGRPVFASERQADFLTWAGFKVEATYMTSQDLSPMALIRLIRLGRDKGIVAVIDNQQSGADLGGALASELKIPHVTLSNFPVPNSHESTFFTLLKANVDRLSAATSKAAQHP